MNTSRALTRSKQFANYLGVFLKPVSLFFTGIPRTSRETLYILIEGSIESNTTLTEIFSEIVDDNSYSPPLQRFARTSQRGLIEHNDFTYYLGDAGLLPSQELDILKIGQATDSLEITCRYLIDQFKNELLFNRYVRQNSLNYVLAPPIGIALAYFGGDFLSGLRRLEENGEHVFFAVADFTTAYWPFLLAAYGLPIVLHQYLAPRLTRHRALAKRIGFYNIYDLEQEIKLGKLCAALVPTRLPTSELIRTLSRVFPRNPQLRSKIDSAGYKVSEFTLIEILALFCAKQTMHRVRAKAKPETPQKIGQGFSYSVRIMTIMHSEMVKGNNALLVLSCTAISAVFIGPLVMLVAGI